MPILFLLRHGEIPQTTPRRFVGQRDLPLSAEGRRQARRWRGPFSGLVFQGVWTSDLARCRETARLALGEDGPAPAATSALRELALGEWEGLTEDEVRARFPGELERRRADMANVAPAGGESFARLRDRAWPALLDILDRSVESAGPLLVVAHAGVNRALICQALAMPLSRVFGLDQDYACLNILRFAPGRPAELAALNLPQQAAGPVLRRLGLKPGRETSPGRARNRERRARAETGT